jgi:hypothetical protein
MDTGFKSSCRFGREDLSGSASPCRMVAFGMFADRQPIWLLARRTRPDNR